MPSRHWVLAAMFEMEERLWAEFAGDLGLLERGEDSVEELWGCEEEKEWMVLI